MSTPSQFAEAYVRRYGIKIVKIEPGEKGPRGSGWNKPGGYFDDPDSAGKFYLKHPNWNMGVVLGPSNLCSIDVDHVEYARMVMAKFNIDIDQLADTCPTIVGNPARFRTSFAIPDGVELGRKTLSWPNPDDPDGSKHAELIRQAVAAKRAGDTETETKLRDEASSLKRVTVIEFRAGDVQDVLPPSIHPKTGKPYHWRTKPNGKFPELPAEILKLWQDWDKFRAEAEAICPWQPKQKPAPKKATAVAVRDGMGVIEAYNTSRSIEHELESYGYQLKPTGRWLSPHSSTGDPGVWVQKPHNRVWNEHASDPLCSDTSGKPISPFDLFCYYEHNGDVKSAVKAAANILGMSKPAPVAKTKPAPANIDMETGEILPDSEVLPPDSAVELAENGYAPQYSDSDLALRHVSMMNGDTLWCETWGRWLLWQGDRWLRDETLMVQDKIRRTCMNIANELLSDIESGGQDKRIKQANQLSSYRTISSVERLARSDRRVATHPDEWDADVWLLNTPGGVVDLRDGSIRPHQRTDKITKSTSVAPVGDCPTWTRFLDDATAGDVELQGFLQRMCGYVLTGTVREHALFFVYGTGGNGKGTFLNTITSIMGDYQRVSGAETFTESRGDRHETELARLQGARLVSAQETEEGKRWAESRIKALTGGDPITARYMRQDYFTFIPQFKLVIAGNHKPSFRAVDEAIRRRLHLIPFTVSIPAEKRDPFLPEKLKAEAGGILAWMIQGCLMWQRDGLNPPAIVKDSTDLYLEEEDSISQWLEECCIKTTSGFAASADLYRSWQAWTERNGEIDGTKKRLSHRLESLGFVSGRQKQTRGFFGISLLPGGSYGR